MVDRIRYPTVSYLPFYYVFFQFLLLTIFNLQANILTTKDILSNLGVTQFVMVLASMLESHDGEKTIQYTIIYYWQIPPTNRNIEENPVTKAIYYQLLHFITLKEICFKFPNKLFLR